MKLKTLIFAFAAALVIRLGSVRIPIDMQVVLHRSSTAVVDGFSLGGLCAKAPELTQDVGARSIAPLAVYQQGAVFLVDVEMTSLAAQRTGGGDVGAPLLGALKERLYISQV